MFTRQTDYDHIVIWLDAGHGGVDAGTYTTFNGQRVYEKDIVLDIVLMIYTLFQDSNAPVRVYLTRNNDTHTFARYRIPKWNNTADTIAKADLVVSVHADYFDGSGAQSVYGIQVYYCQNKTRNTGRLNITDQQFAQIMQDHLVSATGARDRGISGDRYLLIPSYSTMPAILIETGFLSNYSELEILMTQEYRMLIATAIYTAIIAAIDIG